MDITEYAMFKKMLGKGGGGNAGGDAEVFIATGDVEIFVETGIGDERDIYPLLDIIRFMYETQFHIEVKDVFIQTVPTLPEKLIKSDPTIGIFVYVDERTGIAYANLDGNILTAGMAMFEDDAHDKGWATDADSITSPGVYCVRKKVNDVTEIPVQSSFDNTGDGVAEVYSFAKALSARFSSGYGIEIDAVKDITDDNGVHQAAGKDSHYMKYDEIAAGTGAMPYAHVYCHEDREHYLCYSFNVAEDGIYELAAHLRIKDEQLRGSTYTINKGTSYEHSFVTTYGWNSEDEALAIRNNDHLQGAYMSGMTVYLHKGINTIHITNAAGVTKNQHFRNLYLVKVADFSDSTPANLTMDEAERMGVGLAKGAKLPEDYYVTVTFNNGAPRSTDGFCRVVTSNGNKMSIQKITLADGQTMPAADSTVILRGKLGCVNSTVNGSIGKEARIFDATII